MCPNIHKQRCEIFIEGCMCEDELYIKDEALLGTAHVASAELYVPATSIISVRAGVTL